MVLCQGSNIDHACPRTPARRTGHDADRVPGPIVIMSAVLGAILSLYRVSATQQREVEGGVRGLVGQKNDLERMSRELRQATQVCTVSPACNTPFSNASSIEFERCAPNGSGGCTLKWVRFDCSGTPGTGGAAQPHEQGLPAIRGGDAGRARHQSDAADPQRDDDADRHLLAGRHRAT